jgi:hypothetical protein
MMSSEGSTLPGPVSKARLQSMPPSFLAEVMQVWLNMSASSPASSHNNNNNNRRYSGVAPSTGLAALLWAVEVCETVSAFGFGLADWHAKWYYDAVAAQVWPGAQKMYGDFARLGKDDSKYHDWEYEQDLLDTLAAAGIITRYMPPERRWCVGDWDVTGEAKCL